MLKNKRGKKGKSGEGKPIPGSFVEGVVKARTCKHCGHHEIGIITKSGKYFPLRSGMRIMVLQDDREEQARVKAQKHERSKTEMVDVLREREQGRIPDRV